MVIGVFMRPALARDGGFTLIEVLVALALVGFALTGVLGAFVASEQLGASGRRLAEASSLARSIAGTLALAPYADPRLADNNTGNSASLADPKGLFAGAAVPTGADAPDGALGSFTVGNDAFDAWVNVSPEVDANAVEQGRQFAVIVRYRVGASWGRVVVLGYRYNPGANGAGTVPL